MIKYELKKYVDIVQQNTLKKRCSFSKNEKPFWKQVFAKHRNSRLQRPDLVIRADDTPY